MKKLMVLALLVAFMMPLAASQALAADETVQAGIVDVGNKMCPVMGGPVDGKDYVVYEGKRYGLCCPGCKAAFLADPVRYVTQVQVAEELNAKAPVAKADSASAEMQRDMEMRDF